MSIEIEQRVLRLEVELQVVRETLQQAAQVQLNTNQAIAELATQMNELARNVNHFVISSPKKQTSYQERQNRSGNAKKNNQFNSSNRYTNGNYNGNTQSNGNNGNTTTDTRAVREQLNSMMNRLDSLMTYLEQPGSGTE